MTQCRACGHISIDSDGLLCHSCCDLHVRALERMEEGDGVMTLAELSAMVMTGEYVIDKPRRWWIA